jgi:hypothetical protein
MQDSSITLSSIALCNGAWMDNANLINLYEAVMLNIYRPA